MKFKIVEDTGTTVNRRDFRVGGVYISTTAESETDRAVFENIIKGNFYNYNLRDDIYTTQFVATHSHATFGYEGFYSLLTCGDKLYRRADVTNSMSYMHSKDKIKELTTGHNAVLLSRLPGTRRPDGYVACNEVDALVAIIMVITKFRYFNSYILFREVINAVLTADREDKINMVLGYTALGDDPRGEIAQN